MRMTAKPVIIGVPALLAIALAVILALWAWGGSGQGGALAEQASVSGVIEYTVRDSNNAVKEHLVIQNTTVDGFLNAAASRLSTAQTVSAGSGVYENLQLCDTNATTTSCTNTQLIKSIKDAAGGAANNPAGTADTAVTGPSGIADGVGSYQVQDTFFCGSGDCQKILKLELTAGSGAAGSADGTIGAYQAVDVTLASGDSL